MAGPAARDQRSAAIFTEHRPRLMGIAYRMLGSVADAEDVVQDAYLRWQRADHDQVEVPAAWLTRTVTNLAINLLGSAPRRHEGYTGTWLPEPIPTGDGRLGPLETITERETLSIGLLRLQELLTPAERGVFVLHEAFGYRHQEVADLLGLTEQASRQLLSRARKKLAADPLAPARPVPDVDHERLVRSFLDAVLDGELDPLRRLLADDVESWADGGGRVTAARRPVRGSDNVARYWSGLTGRPEAAGVELIVVELNGRPALLARARGEALATLSFEIDAAGIRRLWLMVNPDKLGHLTALGSAPVV
ncbi:RNA polymerase sigma factor SigJ [Microlunatus soli]|uniref:RNA polymerase, sigma subunit, ECF family n=1 Tax=Microlunatus soli TaxID=630515 RepID=A0A1H1RIX0_9ACTN|nr:RNA polymerase sigma factor SigJ [Microlunatus soli]SDS35476.1 RNA polymerase, sigma subunit, ECF family [Microlunatus soli]